MKIKWGLVDKDERFIMNFKTYIQTYHNHEIDLHAYSVLEDFNEYENKKSLNVIVISEECLSKVQLPEECSTVVVLTMSSTASNENLSYSLVNRFNSSKEIVEKTLSIYYEKNKLRLIEAESGRPSEIISFYSPIGGAGKTVLSIAYAKLLAEAGKKVLFFSFDQYLSLDLMIKREDKADITYLLASYGESVVLKNEIEKIKVDTDTGLSFVRTHQRYKDIIDLDAKNDSYWKWFISSLVQMDEYEYIIMDIPTDLNDKHIDLLELSSGINVVINDGTIERSKVKRFVEQLPTFEFYAKHQELDSINYILNDAKNIASTSGYDEAGIDIAVTVPYDSSFKAYNVKDDRIIIKTNSVVGEKLSQLIG